MSAFGAGTLPMMMLLTIVGHRLSFSVRSTIRKAVPYLMTAMAVLLILRGMNLGIPFISPIMAGSGRNTGNMSLTKIMYMTGISSEIDGSSLQRHLQNIVLLISETHLFTLKYNDHNRYVAQ